MGIEHVGFSGTREGMNDFQKGHVSAFLKKWFDESQAAVEIWFHHGDCIGADEQSHRIAKELNYYVHLHPPLDEKYGAHLASECDKVDPPYSYHGRNHRIVIASNVLIMTPKSAEILRSGTWATIRYARAMNKPHVIVFKDRVELHGVSPWEVMK